MSLWLTKEELAELTGYRCQRRQKTALGKMRIPFISRDADGFPLVQRSQFESHPVLQSRPQRREPNLNFLRRA